MHCHQGCSELEPAIYPRIPLTLDQATKNDRKNNGSWSRTSRLSQKETRVSLLATHVVLQLRLDHLLRDAALTYTQRPPPPFLLTAFYCWLARYVFIFWTCSSTLRLLAPPSVSRFSALLLKSHTCEPHIYKHNK